MANQTHEIMKKLILAIPIAIGSLFCITQCTKVGKNISVVGKVINTLTGEGIADQEIYISRNQSLTIEGGGKKVKSTRTDANGDFRLDRLGLIETHVANAGNIVNMYHLGWYNGNGEQLTKSAKLTLPKGKTTRANYHVVPYGSYRISINNINCQGPNDTIIINRTNYVGNFLGNNWVLTGCNGYLTSFNNQTPMGPIYTNYTVIRNGVSASFYQEFYVQPNQENTQVINY